MLTTHKILLSALALLLMCGCSDDDTPQPTPYRATAFATITGKSDSGTTLQWQRLRNSEVITLSTTQILADRYAVGSRVVVNIETAMADTTARPMPVTIQSISQAFSSEITIEAPSDITMHRKAQAEILSQWLTDEYLNMQLKVDYDGSARSLALTADANTLNSDTVVCYLYNPGDTISQDCVQRRAYASFPLSSLNIKPNQTVKALPIH